MPKIMLTGIVGVVVVTIGAAALTADQALPLTCAQAWATSHASPR
jgi:hypothetical protein